MSAAPARRMRFAFDAADHAAIASLVHEQIGIVLSPAKTQLVYGRLAPRVRAAGLDRFADYVRLIHNDDAERRRAVDALTTNHTAFFRERHHYDHFLADAWPALAGRLATGGRVRLWSAACSSGEEPVSLAMAILGADRAAGIRLARRDLRILATDISDKALNLARTGRYPAAAIQDVPPALRTAWLRRQSDTAAVHPEALATIAYRPLNLLERWPIRRPFDAIFCRNVMIYFDEPTKQQLQSRLADQLVDGGLLYIGHSEHLSTGVAERFVSVGRTAFRKRGI